ncbi:MAG TPA: 30S ribosomal protein S6 [Gemmataceae bacterium]|nr:30S ribosomal protein S6 [Gemmataceae bacterium]
MPANVYECMFLLDTNRVAGDVTAAGQQIRSVLERNQAEILASRPWDERRLAYPVQGHKKGLYFLTYFRMDGKNLLNFERDIALNELILRTLVLRIHPKHVDTLLAIARDEHALALQVAPEPTGEGGEPVLEEVETHGGPRRGRRHADEDKREL